MKNKKENYVFSPGTSKPVRWLVRVSGYNLSEKEASYIIVFAAAATVLLFLFLILGIPGGGAPPEAMENPERGVPVTDSY